MSPRTTPLCSLIFLVFCDHGLYVVYIRKQSYAHELGGVNRVAFPFINCFNETEAAISPCELCFLRIFPCLRLILFIC